MANLLEEDGAELPPGITHSIVQAEVPESCSIETVGVEDLLEMHREAPEDSPEELTRDFGTLWVKEARSLCLVVPSVVNVYDRNVLMNPLHPEFEQVRVIRNGLLRFDPRFRHVPGLQPSLR